MLIILFINNIYLSHNIVSKIKNFIFIIMNLNSFSLLRFGDIESNAYPNNSHSLTIFRWNLSGITAYKFDKMTFI